MACCTNNNWTKVISVLTIIFCLLYIVAQILILVLKENTIVKDIDKYLIDSNPKTEILIYCSIVFNTLWIIATMVLLIFLSRTETNEYSMKETQKLIKVYITWIILGFLSFLPDIVSVIIHSIYYSSSDNDDESKKQGALYMLVLSSRFVVLLPFHIFSWIGIIIITSALQKSLMEEETKPKGRIVPLKPPKPTLKPSKVPYLEETNADRVRDWYKHYEGDKNVANGSNYHSEPNDVPNYFPRLHGTTNSAYISNNNYEPIPRPVPPVPPPKPNHMPGLNTNVLVNGVPSGTLRRQLPWSYMPQGMEIPQRKETSVVSSNTSAFSGFAPYVPAPDYISNPKKIQRQEFNKPGWNQYL